MSSNIKIKLNTSEEGTAAVFAKLSKGLDKTIDKLNKVEKQSIKTKEAYDKWGKKAKAVHDSVQTPLAKHTRKLRELFVMVKKGSISQGTYTKAVAAQNKEFRRTSTLAGQAQASIGTMMRSYLGVAAASAAIFKFVQLAKAEIANFREIQNKKLGVVVEFGEALPQAVRNVGGLLSQKELRREALGIARRQGVGPVKSIDTISAAISASGALNKREAQTAIKAAETVLEFAPELEVKDAKSLAASIASLMKRFNVNAKAALGFIVKVGSLSNVFELGPLVQNIAPVIANLTQGGMSLRGSGSLVSTISQGVDDVTGQVSAQAALGFERSLRKRFPHLNPEVAIQKLIDDPELQKKFFAGGVFKSPLFEGGRKKFGQPELGRKKAEKTLQFLTTKGTKQNIQYEEGKARIGGFKEGEETYRQTLAEINKSPSVQIAKRKRRAEAAQKLALLEGITDAGAAITAKSFKETKLTGGRTAFRTYFEEFVQAGGEFFGADPRDEQDMKDLLRDQEASIRFWAEIWRNPFVRKKSRDEFLSKADKERIKGLRSQKRALFPRPLPDRKREEEDDGSAAAFFGLRNIESLSTEAIARSPAATAQLQRVESLEKGGAGKEEINRQTDILIKILVEQERANDNNAKIIAGQREANDISRRNIGNSRNKPVSIKLSRNE